MTGIIFDIKEFAVFDGPGIRTTVFMKGCPLHCMWCHNPEGLKKEPELMVSVSACIHCGNCTRVCRHPEHCIACGECIPVCRGGFRKIAGQVWTQEELVERLEKSKDDFALTGGGVTFSGGEPFLQWPFVRGVIERLKKDGIHTAIETSAVTSDENFRDAMRLCSLIMMDWKASDPEVLQQYTGADLETVRRHLKMLVGSEVPFIVRMPIIPQVNDNREHFETVRDLVKDAPSLVRVDILPYQPAAGAKYEMIGRKYAPTFDETKKPQMFAEVFQEAGIAYQLFR